MKMTRKNISGSEPVSQSKTDNTRIEYVFDLIMTGRVDLGKTAQSMGKVKDIKSIHLERNCAIISEVYILHQAQIHVVKIGMSPFAKLFG
jgi:hypothetical protein